MRKLLILMLLGVLFVPMNGSAKADQVLYCQSELATGMGQKNDTWVTGSFKRERYTVKVIGDFEEVTGLDNYLNFDCVVPLKKYPKRIVCRHWSGKTFLYDKSSKRFVFSSVTIHTYIRTDTPALFAGTCEKF